jgi:hypothetical protein
MKSWEVGVPRPGAPPQWNALQTVEPPGGLCGLSHSDTRRAGVFCNRLQIASTALGQTTAADAHINPS